jgi:NADPH2:quinone reductase
VRAIVVREFGGPEVLRIEDLPETAPASGQVAVRIHAAGVNPVETYIRSGQYVHKPPLPWTPGFDGAGVIDAVGKGVAQFRAGDRVYLATLGAWTGTYAQRTVCDARHAHPLPDQVTFGQGAALGVPAATAHRALFGRARSQTGDTVLVHGASGAVGVATVQLAKAAGLTVFGTAGTDEGLALARQAGAVEAFNHHDPAHAEQVRRATGGRGVDVIVEMLANANLDIDLSLLAPRGRIVVVGSRGRVEIDPRQTMAKDAAILGMALWNVPPDETVRIHADLGRALEAGTLRPVVGREFPLADAPEAHKAVLDSPASGKIVLIPT